MQSLSLEENYSLGLQQLEVDQSVAPLNQKEPSAGCFQYIELPLNIHTQQLHPGHHEGYQASIILHSSQRYDSH